MRSLILTGTFRSKLRLYLELLSSQSIRSLSERGQKPLLNAVDVSVCFLFMSRVGYRLTNGMLNRIGQNVFTAFKLIVLMKADNSGVQP